MRQQLFKGQTLLRRLPVAGQLFEAGAHRRVVHEAQRRAQAGQLQGGDDVRRQQIEGTAFIGIQRAQGAVYALAQSSLGHAFSQRIDRRQRGLQRLGLRTGAPVFGMDDL